MGLLTGPTTMGPQTTPPPRPHLGICSWSLSISQTTLQLPPYPGGTYKDIEGRSDSYPSKPEDEYGVLRVDRG